MQFYQEPEFKSAIYCKICGDICNPYDVVDFNRSCEEPKGKFLPLSGIPVYYFKCKNCGFLFAPVFDSWPQEKFKEKIYNDKYIDVDPDYIELRPKSNARYIEQLFGYFKNSIRHIDYGGGNGLLSSTLNALGWKSSSYDPLVDTGIDIKLLGKFQFVTAFEVFEHSPDPKKLMDDLELLIAEDGLILFTTVTSDGFIAENTRLNWWYASPRNGHISLYSHHSLSILFNRRGFNVADSSNLTHIAFKQIPYWAKHLFQQG